MCANGQRSSCKIKGATLVERVVAISLMTIIMRIILAPISSAPLSSDVSCNNVESMLGGRLLIDHIAQPLPQAFPAKFWNVLSTKTSSG